MKRMLKQLTFLAVLTSKVSANCAHLKYCNGHGVCDGATSRCNCFEGYGAPEDISLYKAPDCSALTCPSGLAWADVPTAAKVAHAAAECSNMGTCNRKTGTCECFAGFEGEACQKNICPNSCSGHGQCLSMKQMARMENAQPLNNNTYYEGSEDGVTWDESKLFGCVCDSSWTVGLESGETQQAEWFGADCSLQRCPSADDPFTDAVETDCVGQNLVGGSAKGVIGNLCHVDCANRGVCDYNSGKCNCFNGYYGTDCSTRDVRATYGHNSL